MLTPDVWVRDVLAFSQCQCLGQTFFEEMERISFSLFWATKVRLEQRFPLFCLWKCAHARLFPPEASFPGAARSKPPTPLCLLNLPEETLAFFSLMMNHRFLVRSFPVFLFSRGVFPSTFLDGPNCLFSLHLHYFSFRKT